MDVQLSAAFDSTLILGKVACLNFLLDSAILTWILAGL